MMAAFSEPGFYDIDGLRMACRMAGQQGPTLLFLHGNPTSSLLWRDIVAPLASQARCIAPDLVGMGESDKLPDSGPGRYGFIEHRDYLDGLLEQLDLGDEVVLVLHDWGSALGFDWARRHPERVAGLVYMEALVRPLSWAEWPAPSRGVFEAMRSAAGDELVLQKNLFVEKILPASIQRELSDDEMQAYRAPFENAGEDRRPTLSWPRQLPIDGEPAEVVELVQAYADWLSVSDLPKLFINAEPGAILVGPQRDFCRSWPNQQEVSVSGIHFIQEDSAAEIAAAIAGWHPELHAL
jgi:haloalkane dehalogenase